ncbi:SulP family inorganic anion transporter [Longimicrobium sp.]|uniref:SulP family inorganic anion transporter n=1 Tax=Longimicrobium sp. TaxID=2029185 RepID=UPI002E307C72|nr:SulP family inorganic anion transporter [Longimicrobium sp.]HEX6042305.1 SulP family inorganic anion transporter [Longimicrobium sp.]
MLESTARKQDPVPEAHARPAAVAQAGPAAEGSPWRDDLGAGLVVFLVALPLCLGIALASGAPLAAGLVTGAVGGLVVSRLSGSQLMVSGPAAGLTAIVLAAITELGSYPAFLVAVVLAGLLQLGLGAARAGVIGYFFPSSVIRGMLAGIGLILVIKQVPYALGLGHAARETPEAGTGGAGGPVAEVFGHFASILPSAALVAGVSLVILTFWPKMVSQRVRRMLPAPLAVVLVGGVGAWLLGMFVPAMALPREAMVTLPVPQSIGELATYFTLPDWSALGNPAVWRIAATLAIVASLESLLSLEATDRLDRQKRVSPPNRELLAQGTGNVLAGMVGGLPMTGVIVRSAANVDAGGRTWRSAFIHGVLLVVAVASVPALLNLIPLAALAAVLIHTGFKLANPAQLVDAWKRGPRYAVPFVATVVAILATDLLIGIAVGLAVGVFFLLLDSARNAYSFERHESEDHQQIRLTLAEEVTFLNKAQISKALQTVPEGTTLTVDATRSRHLDEDVVELLHEYRDTARRRGVHLVLKGVPGHGPVSLMH